jgi:sugar transport system permease protein
MNQRINRKSTALFALNHVTEIVLVLVVVMLTIAAPRFLTLNNWMNILRSGAIKGIIALGITMILICGKIDLSTGSMVALSGVIVAVIGKAMTANGYSLTLACIIGMVAAILMAILFGFIHARLQDKFNLPPFIVTLATQYLLFGFAATICNGYPIPNMYPDWFKALGMGRLFGIIPYSVIIFMIMWCFCYFLMEHTTTGRSIFAVGGNQEAARLSGINVFKSKAIVFIAVQVCAAIAGFINSAQVMNADYTYAKDWPMDVISMAIIGGTSMAGGSGTIYGTLIGVVLISALINGMTMLNWSIYLQYVVRGLILLGALLIMTLRDKMRD